MPQGSVEACDGAMNTAPGRHDHHKRPWRGDGVSTIESTDATAVRTPRASGTLSRLFAWWYPKLMGVSERAGQADVRRAQLGAAAGRTLEIGVGSGLSLPHYGDRVTELVLLEPNEAFHPELLRTIEGLAQRPWSWRLVSGDGHQMPFDDSTFDTVTASLTFCSVADPARVLDEVFRVLRPGGRLLFHEHVRGEGTRARLQDALAPLQVALADGCHPNRDFLAAVEASPLRTVDVVASKMPRGFPTVTPIVHGTAVRPVS
jgi:SAM-dependent methyltransferase